MLQKYGVELKIENGKQYYEAFGGQVTWVGAADAEKVYFRYKDDEGILHGYWIDR
jgi:hypothetical protein